MMKLLVLLALVAMAASDGHKENGMQESWEIEPCCFPDLWAGEQITTTLYKDHKGHHEESKNILHFHVDFSSGQMKGDEAIIRDDETVANISFVADFNKKYVKVYSRTDKQCFWYDAPSPFFRQCISKKAKFVETTHVGVGDSSVTINIFQDSYEENGNEMKMTVGVTPEKCVPVFIKVEGELMDGKMEFKRDQRFWGSIDEFETDGLFDYEKQLDKCHEFKEIDTPDEIKGMVHIADQFFPKTSPRKCCFPDSWEGKASLTRAAIVDGDSILTSIDTKHFAVNYKYKKFLSADKVYVDGVSTHNITFKGNLQYGTLYAIDMMSKNCSRYNIPSVSKITSQCITQEAEYMGMPTIGLKEGGLQTSHWKISTDSSTIDYTVAHQDGFCVPLSSLQLGDDYMGVTSLYDVKEGVEDPEIFDPPETCNGIDAEDMPADIRDIIGDAITQMSRP